MRTPGQRPCLRRSPTCLTHYSAGRIQQRRSRNSDLECVTPSTERYIGSFFFCCNLFKKSKGGSKIFPLCLTARNARTSLTCNCAQKKSTRTNRCALRRRRCQKNCISLPLSRGRRKMVQFSQDIRPVAAYCPKGKRGVVFLHRKCAFAGSKKTKNCNLMTSGKLNVSRKKQKEKEKKCNRLLPQNGAKIVYDS